MLRLLKFELKRKWKLVVGLLVAYFLLNYMLVLKLKDILIKNNHDFIKSAGNSDVPEIAVLVFLLAFGLITLSILDAVNNMRLELKRNTRDLYFSLPIDSYSMLGAKLTVSLLGILGATVIAFATWMYSWTYLFKYDFIGEMLSNITENFSNSSYLFTEGALSIVLLLLLVYLTFGIYRSFFSQFKYGGIITVLLYVGVNYIFFKFLGRYIELDLDSVQHGSSLWAAGVAPFLTLLACDVMLFLSTGYLLGNRVNFD